MYTLKNIFRLGVKELQGLFRDYLLIGLIVYSFSVGVYVSYQATPDSLTHATIAIVDEDNSQLSKRISDAFFPHDDMKSKANGKAHSYSIPTMHVFLSGQFAETQHEGSVRVLPSHAP